VNTKGLFKKTLLLSGLGLISALPFQANASGYKLEFQSPSVLADAGEAAVVEDAGTNWYNSAGLVYLPQQYVLAGTEVWQSTRFNGQTTAATGVPVTGPVNSTATSKPHVFLPAVHYVHPIKDRFAVGISLVPAWGLMEQYGNNDSVLRYDLVRIYTKTIDIEPSFAMKINKQWSVGLGPDIHYFQVLNTSNVFTSPPPPFGLGTTGDSISRYSASDWNYGWHIGALFRPNEATRIGLNYRSKIVEHLAGHSDFAVPGGPLAGLYETNQFRVNIPLPPTTTLSVYRDITARWALMGTIAYDQWGVIKGYYAKSYIQPVKPNLINVSLVQGFHNTFDLSFGTHYKLNDQWMLRASFKYLPTPTNGAYRDVAFPDGPKYGINFGARYTMNKKFAFDMIYGHVFSPQVGINSKNPVTGAASSGSTQTSINLVGAQLVWNI
jgi:long-chain fatty acid transport protein